MQSFHKGSRVGMVALLAAWSADQLFWGKEAGVSFVLMALLLLAGGLYLSHEAGEKPAWTGTPLGLAAVLFAGLAALRAEPFTRFINALLALSCLWVLAATWLGGRWLRYSLSDYILQTLRLGFSLLAKPPLVFVGSGQEGAIPARKSKAASPLLSVLLGLLLALPALLLLGALLSEADPIFAKRLGEILSFLRIEKLQEYILRLALIGLGAAALSGVYLHALLDSREEKLVGLEKPVVSPFLGWLVGGTVLASVDALFGFFVVIQFQYFFGGQANIHLEGFTYAEYARRGFGELLVTAALSLGLFLGLSALTRRESDQARRIFSGLGVGLTALLCVMLVSALQRLLLYEAAYGFSRLRTYTHVFLVWLGVLLLVTMGLEIIGRMRAFALVAVLVSLGFGLSLNILNVDAFIVRQNTMRAAAGQELDLAYLAGLSEDAVPVLFAEFHNQGLSGITRARLGAALACIKEVPFLAHGQASARSWPSFHWADYQARRLFEQYAQELEAYPVRQVEWRWVVEVGGAQESCLSPVD